MHAQEGYCSWSVCLSVCVRVCKQVISGTVLAVDTKHGDMKKQHLCTVQQESGVETRDWSHAMEDKWLVTCVRM